MKKRFFNDVTLEGYLYDHKLEKKVTGSASKNPGTEYIAGSIDIATDEDLKNIVTVHYSYVVPMTKQNKPNATYTALLNILEGRLKTVMGSSKGEAYKLRVNTAIGLREFYTDSQGDWELVSNKRNEGGFIHNVTPGLNQNEDARNMFEVDMLITGCERREGDPDKNIPDKVIIKGAIFDFRKSLLPVQFSAVDNAAMDYFEGLGATNTNPVFTRLRGKEVSTVVSNSVEETNAFGGTYVREVNYNRRDYIITFAQGEPYAWDDEETLTAAELKEMMAQRETYLAGLKQNAIDYKNQSSTPAPAATTTSNGGYNF